MGIDQSMERKSYLPAKALVDLLFRLQGGTFIDDEDGNLDAQLQTIDFPVGPEGKDAKRQSAEQGNILVQRSIITLTDETLEECRVLLLHREEHAITTGGSILTSGDPHNSPDTVLSKKVTITPPPSDFKRLGIALSSPAQTNGIHYLFEIFRSRIDPEAQIVTHKDHGTLVSLEQALQAVLDKPVESAVLRRSFMQPS